LEFAVHRALWLLLGLRLRGWLRRLRRALSTVRGALLAAFGFLLFVAWLLPSLLVPSPEPTHLEEVRRFGPLALVAFCLLNLIFSTGERAISFTPAEVNLLFPAPFSRRHLLLYKIAGTLGVSLLTALFLTLFGRQHTASFLSGLVGLTLTIFFLQLFSMTLALVGSAVGAQAYNRRRKLVLALVVAVLGVAVFQAGLSLRGRPFLEILEELEQTPVVQIVLAPVGWLIQAATAERLWPDLVQWAALGLLLDLCLLGVVLALDAHYLETAAAASEKLYARLQKLRRGTPTVGLPPSGTVRVGLPSLPGWGGIGPLLWRQLTTTLRSPWSVVLLVIVFGLITTPVFLDVNLPGDRGSPGVAVSMLVGMALFVPPLLPFDFRGDLDRMDLLKTLPVAPWRLVVGQLLTPVLLLTVVQLLVLAAVQILGGQLDPVLAATAFFLVPGNLLLFEVENLAFLLFPYRLTGAGPADFQMVGRQMLLWLGKIVLLLVVVGVAGLAGLLAFLVTGQSWLAFTLVAWAVGMGAVAGMLPLLVLAFRQFDVARDLPP
jgi:hypothetical protein